jgi:hypothetical protein
LRVAQIKTQASSLKGKLATLSPHLRDMLEGALAPVQDEKNPTRFVSAAHGLRELLREVLAHFAPDDKIKVAKWFVPNPTSRSGVTRAHRTKFAVYEFVSPAALPKSLADEVDDLARNISEHVEHLSEYAHPTAEVLARDDADALDLLRSTLDLFSSLLSAIANGQEVLADELQIALTTKLNDIFISDFFDDLDCLSSHTRVTGAEDVEVSVTEIDEEHICFSGIGTVTCELQYGSDGDCARGDGVEWEDSFPFTFKGTADLIDLATNVRREDVSVNTDSQYED